MNRRMKPKVCFVATVEIAVKAFLVDHFKAMNPQYDITVVTNTDDVGFLERFGLDVTVISLAIERKISLFRDIVVLFQLCSCFRRNHFAAIHSITPKSGLLSMVAGFLVRVPVRIHTFTGQVWATRAGFMRFCLKAADRIIACCATHILVDSHSQRDFLIGEKVISKSASHVIANGSMCGVDVERFSPSFLARKEIRFAHGIPESDVVFLFLGRLTHDKGLMDLAEAFKDLCDSYLNIHLVVVGPDEENIRSRISAKCSSCVSRLHFENYTDIPERYMAASDVFCLPSYREGFGSVIIEAASAGIPSIGTRIYGLTDAIDDGQTGFLYEPGDIDGLRARMLQLIEGPDMIKKMGEKARKRVVRDFSKERVISEMLEYYKCLFPADCHSLQTKN